ncbi:MAG TPA: trehalose-6-phosphate synthase [Acidimicrobiales bacterium]|nr:trehalose-6-phosphate synthase [Acidimicrobiales bacterium]
MPTEDLVIVSNRGPLSFTHDDGELVTSRGAGGLVTSLGPAVAGTGATWIAAAITEADREAAETGVVEAEGFRLRSLVVDEAAYRPFYDVISNSTIWYLHHGLWDRVRRPRFDRRWRDAWEAYREVNQAFAEAAAAEAPRDATVLVHDYQLSLVPARLVKERPDLSVVYFHHTPFCSPAELRALPAEVGRELLEGVAAARACGFHADRWAQSFEACVEDVLGEPVRTFVSPAAADADDLRSVAASAECAAALAELDEKVGDRKLLVRVDRIELSKNILRGFHAFEELLVARPDLRGRVTFAACVYPSRQTLPDYLAYRQEVTAAVERINGRFAKGDWLPVLLDTSDDFPRSVAALRRYDALLVNPIRDGLNLVAFEGPIVNERDGVLVLSPEAGAWQQLGRHALEAQPFDVTGTAEAIATALTLDAEERAGMASDLRRVATARTARDWLHAQLAAAGGD